MNVYEELLYNEGKGCLDEARRREAFVLATSVLAIQQPDTTFFEMVERIEKYLKGDGTAKD